MCWCRMIFYKLFKIHWSWISPLFYFRFFVSWLIIFNRIVIKNRAFFNTNRFKWFLECLEVKYFIICCFTFSTNITRRIIYLRYIFMFRVTKSPHSCIDQKYYESYKNNQTTFICYFSLFILYWSILPILRNRIISFHLSYHFLSPISRSS